MITCFFCGEWAWGLYWRDRDLHFGAAFRAFVFKHDDTECTYYFRIDQERMSGGYREDM